jgi:protein arginine kinase
VSVLQALIEQPCAWLGRAAPRHEIVLSSRVRLARNLGAHPFPQRASRAARAALLQEVFDKTQTLPRLHAALRLPLESLDPIERQFLGERQLVSRDLVESPQERGAVIAPDESYSFMINEEDHLRMQAIRGGLALDEAFHAVEALDDDLDGRLDLAFSERFGFLTSCPTNTGTGMRASVLIHLPGVVLGKELDRVFESLRAQDIAIRGFYGEGSAAMGNFFQISNATTLGVREGELLEKLDRTIRELTAWEVRARQGLLSRARSLLEDKIWRSYGILRYARVLSSKEVLSHVSLLRLGVGLGILELPLHVLNEIVITSQPAHVTLRAHVDHPTERDARRAEMVRGKLQQSES